VRASELSIASVFNVLSIFITEEHHNSNAVCCIQSHQ
jgi:Rps23 Pro-64 3,4-dihydroxylase Tpa1-like proline 4-hydroxylase